MVLNISSPSSDAGVMARYFLAANFSPNGFNFEQWKDDEFEDALKTISESTDPKAIVDRLRKAHERLVDNPPWLYIVHDLNPRAMSPKVKGFVSPQSWFVDLTWSACNSETSGARYRERLSQRLTCSPGIVMAATPAMTSTRPSARLAGTASPSSSTDRPTPIGMRK